MNFFQRDRILNAHTNSYLTQGYRMREASVDRVVLFRGKPLSHGFHFALTLITCGLWLPVWLTLYAFAGERVIVVEVMNTGYIRTIKQRIR